MAFAHKFELIIVTGESWCSVRPDRTGKEEMASHLIAVLGKFYSLVPRLSCHADVDVIPMATLVHVNLALVNRLR